jgi:hypothetical protein
MSELRQRQEEFRSKAYLAGSKGAPCTLRFRVCNGDPRTSVPCHVHDAVFGFARKANDLSVVDGCSDCHAFLDHGWVGKISREELLEHIVRAQQETLLRRVLIEVAIVKRDRQKSFDERPIKPRKPPAERKPIANRKMDSQSNWPAKGVRKLNSRQFRGTK